jgi:hypothetical protein
MAAEQPAQQITIRSIVIDNQNVFDPTIEAESGFIYQLTNAFHIRSRSKVVKEYLLFKEGDAFFEPLLGESERILRGKKSLQDAIITYQLDDEFADIFVTTKDTWSLKPKVNVSRKGGVSKTEFGIEEDNLIGLGIRASLSYRDDGERSSRIIKLSDDNISGSWLAANLTYIDSDDGGEQFLSIAKPFYALDVRNSYGGAYGRTDQDITLYDEGKEIYRFRSNALYGNLFLGKSEGLTATGVIRHSIGITFEDKEFGIVEDYALDNSTNTQLNTRYLPDPFQSFFPYYAVSYLQDRYKESKNFEQIGRTEDIYMGFSAELEIGYGSTHLGNDESRWYTRASGNKTYAFGDDKLLFLTATMTGRFAPSGAQNLLSAVGFKYYHAQTDKFKWYVDTYLFKAVNADQDKLLYLDSETGLRGYPLNYISGDHLQKITLEQRYYSDWFLWRIFYLGAAVFFDAGHISGNDDPEKNGLYKDFGVGLRFVNNRSSNGDVIHLDLSYPMDVANEERGWKFAIQSKVSF